MDQSPLYDSKCASVLLYQAVLCTDESLKAATVPQVIVYTRFDVHDSKHGICHVCMYVL